MKRSKLIVAAVLCLAVLAGCTGNGGGSSRGEYTGSTDGSGKDEKPTEAVKPTEVPDEPGPTETPTPEPEQKPAFKGYLTYPDEILSYLDGVWVLNEGSNMIQPVDWSFDTLIFDQASYSAVFHMGYADEEVYYDFDLDDLFSDVPAQFNKLILTERGSTSGYPYSDGSNTSIELSIALVNDGWIDTLVIGDAGNSPSQFLMNALGDERKAGDFWYFRRVDDSDTDQRIGKTGFNEASAVKKNARFFALKYDEYGNECSLQEVECIQESINLSGYDEDLLAYGLAGNGHPFETVTYKYKEKELLAHSGYYDPTLVEVETDANGEITTIIEYQKAVLGYFCLRNTGAPSVARDQMTYGAMDDKFLGYWHDKGELEMLDIIPADPQTGGYYIPISFYRIGQAECYANIDGDRLSLNQGYILGKRIEGYLEINKKGNLVLTITDSEFEYIDAGSIYEYEIKD